MSSLVHAATGLAPPLSAASDNTKPSKNKSITGRLGRAAAAGGRLFRPLDLVLQGAALTTALADGDSEDVGREAGGLVGSLGGGAAGAALGASLGSVVPVIGTAIGGLAGGIIGSLAGGGLGEGLGTKLSEWLSKDKTDEPPPADIATPAAQLASQHNRQIVFSPTIQVTPSGNPDYDKGVADQILSRLQADITPMLLDTGEVDSRADAVLSDRIGS